MLFDVNSFSQVSLTDSLGCVFITEMETGIQYVIGPEKDPEFPGGNEALVKYINANLNFDTTRNLSGYVYIEFIVHENGKITDIVLTQSFDPIYGEAALILVQKMPNWTPGLCGGQIVVVKHTLVLKF